MLTVSFAARQHSEAQNHSLLIHNWLKLGKKLLTQTVRFRCGLTQSIGRTLKFSETRALALKASIPSTFDQILALPQVPPTLAFPSWFSTGFSTAL